MTHATITKRQVLITIVIIALLAVKGTMEWRTRSICGKERIANSNPNHKIVRNCKTNLDDVCVKYSCGSEYNHDIISFSSCVGGILSVGKDSSGSACGTLDIFSLLSVGMFKSILLEVSHCARHGRVQKKKRDRCHE